MKKQKKNSKKKPVKGKVDLKNLKIKISIPKEKSSEEKKEDVSDLEEDIKDFSPEENPFQTMVQPSEKGFSFLLEKTNAPLEEQAASFPLPVQTASANSNDTSIDYSPNADYFAKDKKYKENVPVSPLMSSRAFDRMQEKELINPFQDSGNNPWQLNERRDEMIPVKFVEERKEMLPLEREEKKYKEVKL